MQNTILLVDDEDSLRLSMKARLESHGMKVDAAANGDEAMKLIDEKPYDLVLLDINMPYVSGIQVLEYLNAEHPTTDVIMLTGFSDFSLAMECLKKGAKDYLVKPIDTSELVARLQSFLRARSSERAYKELRNFWQSTVLFNLFGSLRSVDFFLDSAIRSIESRVDAKDVAQIRHARELSGRIVALLRDTVKVAELAEGAVLFQKQETDFGGLVTRICNEYEPSLVPRGLSFKREIASGIPPVTCDADRMEHVVNTILETAVEASKKGEAIQVSVARTPKGLFGEPGGFLVCRVSHGGRAFSSEEITRVLSTPEKDWKQLNDSIAVGTYNLAIARRIVEAQAGTFRIGGPSGNEAAVEFALPLP